MIYRHAAGLLIGLFLLSGFSPAFAQDQVIRLPEANTSGGMPLLEALSKRSSQRSFSEQELPLQVLSDLLWSAWGISRPETGRRTAPSANNRQDIEIYLSMKSGVYRYDEVSHSLVLFLEKDIREKTGRQEWVGSAPLNLIFVSDYSKLAALSEEMRLFYSANHTGYISQNVYLFCASEGLATVVRALVDREMLKAELGLPENKHITLCQTVGYPGE
jgi:SagB-type dehydrogenase family enzyme